MEATSNARVSRWSDAPPSTQPPATATQDADNGEKRPPSSAPEPPFKKSRIDLGQTQGAGTTAGYAGDSASGLVGTSSQGLNTRSAFGGPGYADQGFGTSSAYGGERSYAPGSARGSGTGALFFKTKLCTKFKLGSCTFNDRCHFAHGVEELRKPPAGWEEMVKQGGSAFGTGPSGRSSEVPRRSNKPCRFYMEGNCPYGDRCTFSHGNEDIQRESAPPMDSFPAASAPGRSNYKTRLCSRWEKGELCIYGDKCHFAHGQAELRAYSGGSNYNSSGGTGTSVYNDPGMANPPPMAPPYNVPATYGHVSVPPPSSSANLNPYPVGANTSVYGAQPDGSNGYSMNYPYWSQENKWDGSNQGVPAPAATLPMQNYGQPNPTSWTPNYSMDGGYPKIDNNAAPYYNQDMSQQQLPPPPQQQQQQQPPQQQLQQHQHQQPQPQQQQQQQSVPFYGSVSAYQDPNQSVNAPYVQDAPQNGDGIAYYGYTFGNQQGYTGNPQPVYIGNQQQGYTGSYSTV